MKTKIVLIITTLFITLISTNSANAQIRKFFQDAINNSKNDGLSNCCEKALILQIMVMSPGNKNGNLAKGNNAPFWFVAYGEASIPIDGNGVLSKNGEVTYWFSDRQSSVHTCANGTFKEMDQPAGGGFDFKKTETGQLTLDTYMSGALNLFKQWGWKVTKSYAVGNMLYGEINNGKHTFSISYGAVSSSGGGR